MITKYGKSLTRAATHTSPRGNTRIAMPHALARAKGPGLPSVGPLETPQGTFPALEVDTGAQMKQDATIGESYWRQQAFTPWVARCERAGQVVIAARSRGGQARSSRWRPIAQAALPSKARRVQQASVADVFAPLHARRPATTTQDAAGAARRPQAVGGRQARHVAASAGCSGRRHRRSSRPRRALPQPARKPGPAWPPTPAPPSTGPRRVSWQRHRPQPLPRRPGPGPLGHHASRSTRRREPVADQPAGARRHPPLRQSVPGRRQRVCRQVGRRARSDLALPGVAALCLG